MKDVYIFADILNIISSLIMITIGLRLLAVKDDRKLADVAGAVITALAFVGLVISGLIIMVRP